MRRSVPKIRRALLTAVAVATGLLAALPALPALAQTFEKFDDSAREQLPATPFVGAAYGFIWIALLVYVFVIARGLGGVKNQIEDLRRRIDGAPGAKPEGQAKG